MSPSVTRQQEISKKYFSVVRCLFALDVQKSRNFCSENDTSLSHLQEAPKDNESLAIREAVHLKHNSSHLKHNSSQLPAKSLIAETNTVMDTLDYATGVMRVLIRVGGETRETREEKNIFVFRLFFFFAPLACLAFCDADSN